MYDQRNQDYQKKGKKKKGSSGATPGRPLKQTENFVKNTPEEGTIIECQQQIVMYLHEIGFQSGLLFSGKEYEEVHEKLHWGNIHDRDSKKEKEKVFKFLDTAQYLSQEEKKIWGRRFLEIGKILTQQTTEELYKFLTGVLKVVINLDHYSEIERNLFQSSDYLTGRKFKNLKIKAVENLNEQKTKSCFQILFAKFTKQLFFNLSQLSQ